MMGTLLQKRRVEVKSAREKDDGYSVREEKIKEENIREGKRRQEETRGEVK